MGLRWERSYPYVGGAVAFAGWWYACPSFPADVQPVLGASLTLSAILTGFLATSKAILMSLHGSTMAKGLRESGYIDDLVSYLAQAIWLAFGFSVLSLVGFFSRPQPYFGALWFAIGVLTGLAFIRVTVIFLKILHHS